MPTFLRRRLTLVCGLFAVLLLCPLAAAQSVTGNITGTVTDSSGGVLVNADCFPARDPRIAAADRAAWVRHLAQSYPPDEVRGFFRRWAAEDHYVPLADETAALARAGLRTDVVFRSGAFAVIACR